MKVLDLFCGAAGGWSLGLHRAGYETLAACEIDPWRSAAFSRNFPEARMYGDVHGLTAARLRDDLGQLPDVVVGSPPCQDASAANRNGQGVEGSRTGLFFQWTRLVAECRPLWACAENVPGLRTRGIDRVLIELEALGYAAWPLVVGAVHAGAPHRRNRVWIVAADASGDVLRVEPRRGGGPNGSGATQPREHGAGRAAAADAKSCGGQSLEGLHGPERALVGAVAGTGGGTDQRHPSSGISFGRGADAAGAEVGARGRAAADADQARLEVVGCEPRDDGEELATAERDGSSEWDRWNGGFAARAGRMDDGLPRGVARAALAAYGDAVVPQITEAIGRSMMQLLAVKP